MRIQRIGLCALFLAATVAGCGPPRPDYTANIQLVRDMPGLVAFWDFQRTDGGVWTSTQDPEACDRTFPIHLRRIDDENLYTTDNWPYQDKDSRLEYDDTGPFGHAVRFNRGYIFGEVPREEFDQTPLDISGNRPFTIVAWVKFIDQRHLVAGIWDEGDWDKYGGRRQAALFAGLFGQLGVVAHVSSTGAASFPQSRVLGSRYERMRAIDGEPFQNGEWIAMAMTYDPAWKEVTAYLNGKMTRCFLTDPVAGDVFSLSGRQPANPFPFHWRIFSPLDFVIKFDGQNRFNSNLYEHWLRVSLRQHRLIYGRHLVDERRGTAPYRIHFELQRNGETLYADDLDTKDLDQREWELPEELEVAVGDVLKVQMMELVDEQWRPTGTQVTRQIMEGAPFTFGRAVGLGAHSMDYGSHLYIDGVAVFDRVLSDEELQSISFVEGLPRTEEF